MTTRDPRSRDPSRSGQQSGRDPTQSLSLDPDDDQLDDEPSHPSLALGTHDVSRSDRTKIESPAARSKTPPPPSARVIKPPPIPAGSDEPERVGQVLGSYKVLELLGKGGMGYVFRAEHVKLGREVALKLLRSDYARRRDAVARFFQEARTVNRVRHRNIVDVTDFVELDDGTTFIIMEFLRGQSLGRWARTGVDLPRALAVLVQICDGLGAAHQVGVVHRDLKPDNVIVVPTSDGAELVKLLDFGVAKLLNRDDEDVGFQTAAGSVIGTPAYMSPEQAGGMVVDARSDIYSLGAIMYELFCGQPMFRGRSFGEYVRKHLTEVPVLPRATEHGAGIDLRLEALIMRCLEKDPEHRFGQIFELRDALIGMLGGMETHPPTMGSLSLSASAVRSMPSIHASPSVSFPSLPALVQAGHHHMPQPAMASGLSPSQGYYSQHYSQVGPPSLPHTGIQPRPTPWLVWVIGGAVAIGLGIGGAVWYARRSGDLRPAKDTPTIVMTPTPTPVAEPIEPAPPVRPQVIELRFDSLPAGGVYADGHAVELCRTPCAHNVDLKDGGAADRRTFLVRSAGYKDAVVIVDLSGSQREFKVTLDQLVAEPEPAPDRPARVGKKSGKLGKGKRGEDKKTATSSDVKSESKPDPKSEVNPTTKPDSDTLIDPTDGHAKKPGKPSDKGTIDPSDTLDPFRRKK